MSFYENGATEVGRLFSVLSPSAIKQEIDSVDAYGRRIDGDIQSHKARVSMNKRSKRQEYPMAIPRFSFGHRLYAPTSLVFSIGFALALIHAPGCSSTARPPTDRPKGDTVAPGGLQPSPSGESGQSGSGGTAGGGVTGGSGGVGGKGAGGT